jgi:citrate synthase
MTDKTPEAILEDARRWWSTGIIDIAPGRIAVRGYPIEQLIGRLSYPEMVWLMLRGEIPSRAQASLLEAALVAGVDHGPHAPSIAISRMAVSCGLPVNGAMASAINALDDIHGGAGQQCMVLLSEIDSDRQAGAAEDRVESAIDRFTEAHGKIIPGFGHRWHTLDPRAVRLLDLVEQARQKDVIGGRFAQLGTLIERVLTRRKKTPIPMNIDGATAVIYAELGFPAPLARGLFVLSRSVGILAHAWEEHESGTRIKGPLPRPLLPGYHGAPPRDVERGRRPAG